MQRDQVQYLVEKSGASVTWDDLPQGPIMDCDFGEYQINGDTKRYVVSFLVDEDPQMEVLDLTHVLRIPEGLYAPKQKKISLLASDLAIACEVFQLGYAPIWAEFVVADVQRRGLTPYTERLKGVTFQARLTDITPSEYDISFQYRPHLQNPTLGTNPMIQKDVPLQSPRPEGVVVQEAMDYIQQVLAERDRGLEVLALWGERMHVPFTKRGDVDFELYCPTHGVSVRYHPGSEKRAGYRITNNCGTGALIDALNVGWPETWTPELFELLLSKQTIEKPPLDCGELTCGVDLV